MSLSSKIVAPVLSPLRGFIGSLSVKIYGLAYSFDKDFLRVDAKGLLRLIQLKAI